MKKIEVLLIESCINVLVHLYQLKNSWLKVNPVSLDTLRHIAVILSLFINNLHCSSYLFNNPHFFSIYKEFIYIRVFR